MSILSVCCFSNEGTDDQREDGQTSITKEIGINASALGLGGSFHLTSHSSDGKGDSSLGLGVDLIPVQITSENGQKKSYQVKVDLFGDTLSRQYLTPPDSLVVPYLLTDISGVEYIYDGSHLTEKGSDLASEIISNFTLNNFKETLLY